MCFFCILRADMDVFIVSKKKGLSFLFALLRAPLQACISPSRPRKFGGRRQGAHLALAVAGPRLSSLHRFLTSDKSRIAVFACRGLHLPLWFVRLAASARTFTVHCPTLIPHTVKERALSSARLPRSPSPSLVCPPRCLVRAHSPYAAHSHPSHGERARTILCAAAAVSSLPPFARAATGAHFRRTSPLMPCYGESPP